LPSAVFGTGGIGATGLFSGIVFGSGTVVDRSGGATRGYGGSSVLLQAVVNTMDVSRAARIEIDCFILHLQRRKKSAPSEVIVRGAQLTHHKDLPNYVPIVNPRLIDFRALMHIGVAHIGVRVRIQIKRKAVTQESL
jgi:hypothetical protein